MSENTYRFSNENFGSDHCIYTNIKHILHQNNLLFIHPESQSIKYFDTKSTYSEYDLYKYDIIIHLSSLVYNMYIVPVLYRIKNEMIQKNIHKISDSKGNYIVIYLDSEKELIIDDVSRLVENY